MTRERELDEQAKFLYDLFRAAPVPCVVNGQQGTASFFAKEAQIAQAKLLLRKVAEAGERLGRERAAEICKQDGCDACYDLIRQEPRTP